MEGNVTRDKEVGMNKEMGEKYRKKKIYRRWNWGAE